MVDTVDDAPVLIESLPENQIVPIHFDVPQHFITLKEFTTTAKAAQVIIDNLNRVLFDEQLRIKIVIVPPEDGTFLEQIGLIIGGNGEIFTAGGIFLFLRSEEGKAFLRGMTGHEMPYWFEKAGKLTKEGGEKAINLTVEQSKAVIAWILRQSCISFLEKTKDELQKIGVTTKRFRAACDSKNHFYQMVAANQDIKAVGFDTKGNFPVLRIDFGAHLIDLPEPTPDDDDTHWVHEIVYVEANSPNGDRGGRNWEGKIKEDKKYKKVTFELRDNAFWKLIDAGAITPSVNESLKIQWIYPKDGRARTNIRALRILERDGKEIAKPMTNQELNKLLYSHEDATSEVDQRDLFK